MYTYVGTLYTYVDTYVYTVDTYVYNVATDVYKCIHCTGFYPRNHIQEFCHYIQESLYTGIICRNRYIQELYTGIIIYRNSKKK